MKKILLILAVMADFWSAAFTATAEVYIDEDFEEITSGVPEGWDNSGGTSSHYKWRTNGAGTCNSLHVTMIIVAEQASCSLHHFR